MKNIVICLLFICCGCTSNNFYSDGDFIPIYKKAQLENKKLWVMLGGGDDCLPCNYLLNDIKSKGLFKKYSDEYIFYKCNVSDPNNKFVHYNLLMKEIPNSYIFDEKGVLVYASANSENALRVEQALKSVSKGQKYHYGQDIFITKRYSKLLLMLNMSIKANIDYIEGVDNLEMIEQSINIEPRFYNLFLKYKITSRMGMQSVADSCRVLAREHSKLGWQAIVFQDLYKELDSELKVDSINQPKLKLISKNIDLGEFDCDTQNSISIDLINEGTKPLILYYINTNCSCMVSNFSKKPILPQDKTTINVIYQSAQKGSYVKTVTIQSNAVNYIETITIRGIAK